MNHITVTERVLWTPKGGHNAEEYEDAAFVSESNAWPLRAAVADGATESAFARDWANLLVHGFSEKGATDADSFLQRLRTWQDAFQQALEQRSRKQRAWYAEQKAEQGAFATLLGLTLRRNQSWQALAVGDCCLFHLQDATVSSWPYDAPDAFDDRPALAPSQPDRSAPSPQTRTGDWQPGDAFVLATDALAAWLLAENALVILLALSPDEFQEIVEDARSDGSLRNDDTTALILEIDEV